MVQAYEVAKLPKPPGSVCVHRVTSSPGQAALRGADPKPAAETVNRDGPDVRRGVCLTASESFSVPVHLGIPHRKLAPSHQVPTTT